MLHLHIFVHCVVPLAQMTEWVEYPVRDHSHRVVLIKKLPVSPGVCDHSLHNIVLRYEVDQILFIVLRPFLNFLQCKDIGHPMVHHDPVLGKDGNGGNVLRFSPGRELTDGIRPKQECRADDHRRGTDREKDFPKS